MPNDGIRRELVAGELREMTPAGGEHGYLSIRFGGLLSVYVDERKLGAVFGAETGFILRRDPDTVRAPDVAFISKERDAEAMRERGFITTVPNLVVEVISPSDTYTEVEAKVGEWLLAGCQMVVLVNPRNRTLKVYRSQTDILVFTIDDVFEGGEVVPGFRLPVKRIFGEAAAG
jgi:Uma2 family endonuclease